MRRIIRAFGRDHVTLLAGGVAFAWFLALFPGLIATVMVYGLVTDPADVERQVTNMAEGLPNEAEILLTGQMEKIGSGSNQSLSTGLLIRVAVALCAPRPASPVSSRPSISPTAATISATFSSSGASRFC